MDKAGIYKITNKLTGEVYIGQSIHVNLRIKQHKTMTKAKEIDKLHSDIISLGLDNFDFEILESFDIIEDKAMQGEMLNKLEKHYIEMYDCISPNGYNKTNGGQSHMVVCDSTRQKLSEYMKEHSTWKIKGKTPWNKGKKMSIDACQKIGDSKRGKHLTEEHKRKISEATKGVKKSEETRKRMSIAQQKYFANNTVSEETRKKISEAAKKQKGKPKKPLSEEQKRKISEKQKGRIPWNKGKKGCYSEETIKKISEAAKNISEETRNKMSESAKNRKRNS